MSRVAPRGNSFLLGLFLHSAVDDSDLTVYEFRVYAHLCRRAGDELRVWEGQKKIAACCKMSRAAAQKALYGLRDKGWIELHEGFRDDGSQKPNDIIICGPPASEKGTPPPATKAPPASEKGTLSKSIEGNPEEGKGAAPKTRRANPFFDALVEGLYPGRSEVANSKRVGAVAAELKRTGWTPELITSVLSAVLRREKWWKEHGITPDAFLKNCETWRTKYARDIGEARPRVTPAETTPDDLDWTALE